MFQTHLHQCLHERTIQRMIYLSTQLTKNIFKIQPPSINQKLVKVPHCANVTFLPLLVKNLTKFLRTYQRLHGLLKDLNCIF